LAKDENIRANFSTKERVKKSIAKYLPLKGKTVDVIYHSPWGFYTIEYNRDGLNEEATRYEIEAYDPALKTFSKTFSGQIFDWILPSDLN
jgi:hypothetical protein